MLRVQRYHELSLQQYQETYGTTAQHPSPASVPRPPTSVRVGASAYQQHSLHEHVIGLRLSEPLQRRFTQHRMGRAEKRREVVTARDTLVRNQ
eukprot:1400339-Rhodomonas_salina.2